MSKVELKKLKRATGVTILRSRKMLGLSQEDVAERSGLSRSHVSSIENEICSPTLAAIYGFAQAFEVSPQYLVGQIQSELEQEQVE